MTGNPVDSIEAHPHVFVARVYYEDTDAGGIVYHANYLRFAERARTEWLRALGFVHHQIKEQFGILLVVRHIEIDYRASARLDDELEIHSETISCGNTSLTIQQSIFCRSTQLVALKVVVVGITSDGRPLRLPPQLRQIFGSHTAFK